MPRNQLHGGNLKFPSRYGDKRDQQENLRKHGLTYKPQTGQHPNSWDSFSNPLKNAKPCLLPKLQNPFQTSKPKAFGFRSPKLQKEAKRQNYREFQKLSLGDQSELSNGMKYKSQHIKTNKSVARNVESQGSFKTSNLSTTLEKSMPSAKRTNCTENPMEEKSSWSDIALQKPKQAASSTCKMMTKTQLILPKLRRTAATYENTLATSRLTDGLPLSCSKATTTPSGLRRSTETIDIWHRAKSLHQWSKCSGDNSKDHVARPPNLHSCKKSGDTETILQDNDSSKTLNLEIEKVKLFSKNTQRQGLSRPKPEKKQRRKMNITKDVCRHKDKIGGNLNASQTETDEDDMKVHAPISQIQEYHRNSTRSCGEQNYFNKSSSRVESPDLERIEINTNDYMDNPIALPEINYASQPRRAEVKQIKHLTIKMPKVAISYHENSNGRPNSRGKLQSFTECRDISNHCTIVVQKISETNIKPTIKNNSSKSCNQPSASSRKYSKNATKKCLQNSRLKPVPNRFNVANSQGEKVTTLHEARKIKQSNFRREVALKRFDICLALNKISYKRSLKENSKSILHSDDDRAKVSKRYNHTYLPYVRLANLKKKSSTSLKQNERLITCSPVENHQEESKKVGMAPRINTFVCTDQMEQVYESTKRCEKKKKSLPPLRGAYRRRHAC